MMYCILFYITIDTILYIFLFRHIESSEYKEGIEKKCEMRVMEERGKQDMEREEGEMKVRV